MAQAGIAEKSAFHTFDDMAETFHRLKASGVAVPWVLPGNPESVTLHNVAPWVWHEGGSFMSAGGRHTRFSEAEAQRGIVNYFKRQIPYLAPIAYNLTETQCNEMFRQGEAAATASGHWLLGRIRNGEAHPAVVENLGLAVFPGVPFVGGSNLVIWDYSRQVQPALKLIKFLTSYEVQSGYIVRAGQIPTRVDTLSGPPFATDPHYQVIRQSLETGRAFSATYLWGLVEEKLSVVINKVWSQLFTNQKLDVEKVVAEQLQQLTLQLDRTLSTSSN